MPGLVFRPGVLIARRIVVAWLITLAGLLHAATFNVTDYGAVGDDSKDNTAAFTAVPSADPRRFFAVRERAAPPPN